MRFEPQSILEQLMASMPKGGSYDAILERERIWKVIHCIRAGVPMETEYEPITGKMTVRTARRVGFNYAANSIVIESIHSAGEK